jgi:hypothetical protein
MAGQFAGEESSVAKSWSVFGIKNALVDCWAVFGGDIERKLRRLN